MNKATSKLEVKVRESLDAITDRYSFEVIHKGRVYSFKPTQTGFEITTLQKYGGKRYKLDLDWVKSNIPLGLVGVIEMFHERYGKELLNAKKDVK